MRILFIMLNPSTADASIDDPTIRKCTGFAERLGAKTWWDSSAEISFCGRYRRRLRRPGFSVVNLFDYRATKPSELLSAVRRGEAVSSVDNDGVIAQELAALDEADGDLAIVAWGGPHGTKPLQSIIAERAARVLRMMRVLPAPIRCFGQTQDGHPRHPLMLAYDTPLRPMVLP